jgi:leucyl aminopeptidase
MLENGVARHYCFVGCGDAVSGFYDFEQTRRALGSGLNALAALKPSQIALYKSQTLSYESMSESEWVTQLTIIAHMALYRFDDFKKSKESDDNVSVELSFIGVSNEAAIREGNIIGEAINSTRHLADLPGNIATPTYISDYAQAMGNELGLDVNVFGRERALELGMGGFLSVDAGSHQPGKFVTIEYAPAGAKTTVALVGKGITFDTGGVSLKPSAYMTGMKYDMSGAAAVIGALKAIAQLKPTIRVVGVTPLVENMPGGGASRQDDIITHMNGVTTEIQNTDAEGRLVLSDSLCYAEKYFNPDVMVDVATLTGACPHGLGTFYAGLMTDDKALSAELCELGNFVGDKVWPLPFDKDYDGAIESDVADIANSGKRNYYAGPIVGGVYLRRFVEKTPWAHIDMAGVADKVPGISYVGSGATGAMVRLMLALVMNRCK